MKQVLQDLRTGEVELAELPRPRVRPGCVLIQTRASVISPGTERMLLEFGEAGYVGKARQQPERVRQVVSKLRTDGVGPTVRAIQTRLEEPIALGYSSAGVVLEVGEGVTEFAPGDRVVCNGPHAEVVCVSKNLVAPIPDEVDFEQAAFAVLGAVALHGVRLANPTLGETFVVVGLGLVGILAAQILEAHGCRVIGFDLLEERASFAAQLGLDARASEASEAGIRDVDGVIVATASDSSEPLRAAAEMCRKRGRVVLIGTADIRLDRRTFYDRELSFQVSASYGPGRYDPIYEEKGIDYPPEYVRWTENRNFRAVLDLIAEDRLDVRALATQSFALEDARQAYTVLREPTAQAPLGIVLRYPEQEQHSPETIDARPKSVVHRIIRSFPQDRHAPGVGIVGAGKYARQVLLPALAGTPARLQMVASLSGLSAISAARKFDVRSTTTNVERMLTDPGVHAVFIATRHDSHADLVQRALRAGKHVYVEKPLAIRPSDLDAIETLYEGLARSHASAPLVMVGFNRRFAPHIVQMKSLLEPLREPKTMVMTVNAGQLPSDHWLLDPQVGGGRIIGEACHFIDLLRYLADSPIREVDVARLDPETATLSLRFGDRSIGTVHYFANGAPDVAKERLEVHVAGRSLLLDNFMQLRIHGFQRGLTGRIAQMLPAPRRPQDKGHESAVAAFIEAVAAGEPSPIPLAESLEVSRATFVAAGLTS